MSTPERGPHGDHGQQGDAGVRGETGLTGLKGDTGRTGERGRQGEAPGGVLRLTDRRILVLYLVVVAALAVGWFRVEANTHDIKQNHYETCQDFTAVIVALNGGSDGLELPRCERLRP